jgi:phosphoribosylanthranilate isomerase
VDVSSGIETAPGVKDGHRMRQFVEKVRQADCHVENS